MTLAHIRRRCTFRSAVDINTNKNVGTRQMTHPDWAFLLDTANRILNRQDPQNEAKRLDDASPKSASIQEYQNTRVNVYIHIPATRINRHRRRLRCANKAIFHRHLWAIRIVQDGFFGSLASLSDAKCSTPAGNFSL